MTLPTGHAPSAARFSFLVYVLLAAVSLLSAATSRCAEKNVSPLDRPWIQECNELLRELGALTQALAERDKRTDTAATSQVQFLTGWNDRYKADQILWRLWQVTGLPPLAQTEKEPLAGTLRRNEKVYEAYRDANADKTLQELTHRGLENCERAFGTSYWYMAMTYLREKVDLRFDWKYDIHTTPRRDLKEVTLGAENYRRLSSAYGRWLHANEKQLLWDPVRSRFTARAGGYIGTGDLMEAIIQETFLEAATYFRKAE